MPRFLDASAQLIGRHRTCHGAGEELGASVPAAARRILSGCVERLPPLRPELAERRIEPGDIDGTLGEVGRGEWCALTHLGCPDLFHLVQLPRSVVLRVRLN